MHVVYPHDSVDSHKWCDQEALGLLHQVRVRVNVRPGETHSKVCIIQSLNDDSHVMLSQFQSYLKTNVYLCNMIQNVKSW